MEIGYIPPGTARKSGPRRLITEEEARFADDHDLRALETDRWEWPESDNERIEREKDLLDAHDLRVACVGLWGRDYLNPDVADEAMADLERALTYAEAMDAEVFVTGAIVPESMDREDAWDEGIAFYGELIDDAEEYGVEVAFHQRHGNSLMHSLDDIRRFTDELPNASLKVDPFNLIHWEMDHVNVLYEFNDRIGHFHVKDGFFLNGEHVDQCPAGMGDVEWGKVIDLLHLGGYEGVLSIEPHGEFWGHEAGTAQRWDGIRIAQEYVAQFLRPGDRPST